MIYKKGYGSKKKKIVIKFDEKGDCQFEGFGFEGKECIKAMKPFEDAMGTTAEIKAKPEMHRFSSSFEKETE